MDEYDVNSVENKENTTNKESNNNYWVFDIFLVYWFAFIYIQMI